MANIFEAEALSLRRVLIDRNGRFGGPFTLCHHRGAEKAMYMAVGIALGAAFGVAFGVVMGNLPVGVAMGTGLGVVAGIGLSAIGSSSKKPGPQGS